MVAMPQQSDPIHMTEAEYLAFERESDIKHEYINGEVYAMAGASPAHSLINGRTIAAFSDQLGNCDVYTSDTRVKISASKYVYPDVSVVCGESEFSKDDPYILLNPTIIVEILSRSTEAFDRGDKFQYYRGIDTLQEYILISQDKPRIEGFSRQASGLWTFDAAVGLDAQFALATVECSFALSKIYERVSFEIPEDESGSQL